MKKTILLKLCLIFILGLILRFLYFPNDVYFGYDQARDSYVSLEILKGHLKLIGPPSSADERIFHGPLIYYIYAPFYFLFNLNPEAISALFRIFNASLIFWVFALANNLFGQNVGLISALIFALSYEQSQYSLFLSHPALAVIGVIIYYFGLSLAIFKHNKRGLIFAAIGLGLSIQFHYVNSLLILGLIFYLFIFRKNIFSLNKKYLLVSLLIFLFLISSFVVADIKFNFRASHALSDSLAQMLNFSNKTSFPYSINLLIQRLIHDNFLSYEKLNTLLTLILGFILTVLFFKRKFYEQLIFLSIWFFNGFIPYILTRSSSYYYNPASSVSEVVFFSLLTTKVFKKNLFAGVAILFVVGLSNWLLISSAKGPNLDIVIQPQMFTIFEKRVIDYCYQKSEYKPFALNGLTVPLYINTTWSYLFKWYGLQRYGYMPIWGGKIAQGFINKLPVSFKRSDLPNNQCLIIEPTIGINATDKDNFLKEEDYFSKIEEQKIYGPLTVQFRKKI